MNRQLKQVAVAILAMFGLLLINSNIVQVGQASSLRANPHNVRVLYGEYSHQRGPIVVAGQSVAKSVKTHDSLKYLRTYPGGAEYAPVTGYYSLVYSSSGIEQAENSTLAGTSDQLFFHRISDEITGRTPQGGSVDLTINPDAQHAAYQGLASAPSFNGVRAGAVVALNPQTGAILAMASYPSYDPSQISGHNTKTDQAAFHQITHDPGDPLLNRAVNQSYPPGSTFKVITSATALSSGKYTPSQPLIPAPSKLTFNNTTHTLSNFQGETCPGSGQITLAEALKVSCNTAFGGLGLKLGSDAIAKQAAAFGFGKHLTIPIGVSDSNYVKTSDPPLLADSAIGQYSDSVTPLQMAMVAAGIANHGIVMKPYLVADTKAPDASVLTRARPQAFSQAVSPGVASQLTTMMEGVTQPGGTGTAAAISGIPVAAKTGTAENVPGQPTHAWFIAFAPATHPTVAVAVLVEHGGVGGVAAAPIAHTVMCAVLSCP
ncbi:MAG: penicillin-binding protein 2 [Frankiaceae bacterium]|nr:penicillin-binding protein 2 [Frankiaceae bacterium]MBV9870390.1 penicillin-binding protein 2 [Frankiaceae bacterium]